MYQPLQVGRGGVRRVRAAFVPGDVAAEDRGAGAGDGQGGRGGADGQQAAPAEAFVVHRESPVERMATAHGNRRARRKPAGT
jgi:hypothetical protein